MTNLPQEQMNICRTTVWLRNQKWNTERRILVELESGTQGLVDTMITWNDKVDAGGGSIVGDISAGCSVGGGSGATEGWQNSMDLEMQAKMAEAESKFKAAQAEADMYQSVIVSLEQRQALVAQMLLSGRTENASFIAGVAGGALRLALLNEALEEARTYGDDWPDPE